MAVAAVLPALYLETWHLDIEDFLDLRRNTGDERRRAHDMNTANWIPDLFMKRVVEDKVWTLFSPHEVPDLHDLYGKAFEERYEYYESQVQAGTLNMYKEIPALTLWKKMLSRLFETGHPWLTWKDAFNVRSPQDHAGEYIVLTYVPKLLLIRQKMKQLCVIWVQSIW